MKKFLLHISLIIAGAVILVMGANYVYGLFYEEPGLTAYDNPEFDEMPETLTYVNVGSSHGERSFRYASLGEEIYSQAFNFGMSSQSYTYDYNLLKNYEDRINDEGGVLIIPISVFSLYADEQHASGYDSKILRYYPILDYQYIEGGNRTDQILYRYVYSNCLLLQAADKQIDRIFYLRNDNIEFEDGRTQYDENGYPILVEKNYNALLAMIEFGRLHHMRVLLITTPVQEAYYESYGEKHVGRFHSDVEAFVRDTQVEYWNYEDLYLDEKQYFYDSHHLNEEGASAFTVLVFNRIFSQS